MKRFTRLAAVAATVAACCMTTAAEASASRSLGPKGTVINGYGALGRGYEGQRGFYWQSGDGTKAWVQCPKVTVSTTLDGSHIALLKPTFANCRAYGLTGPNTDTPATISPPAPPFDSFVMTLERLDPTGTKGKVSIRARPTGTFTITAGTCTISIQPGNLFEQTTSKDDNPYGYGLFSGAMSLTSGAYRTYTSAYYGSGGCDRHWLGGRNSGFGLQSLDLSLPGLKPTP